jgi:soluble lytic murein transglycosylase-like protein
MRACVLALLPIAFSQPAFAHGHSHRHASHHSSRQHHYAEHRHHHRAFHQRTPHDRSFGLGEATHHASAPQAFARTDSYESGWQQPRDTQPQWQQQPRSQGNRQQQDGWQQRDVSQASPEWADPSTALDRGTRRAERSSARASHGALDALIARHAAANGLPDSLVHRVVTRESGYNPLARNRSGALGLMQIKYATARGVGYSGSASGLLDAETNLTYAVKYLAGAFQAAGGNANRAVALYQSGYYGRGAPVARRATPATVQVASNWGGQPWDMQTERVAMRDADVTAVRVRRGHRWHHRH